MQLERMEPAQQARGLVHLLSAPEGSFSWAVGMRDEIQACTRDGEFDREYVAHCLGLLLHSGGWRLLRSDTARAFGSFIQFCCKSPPHGLGLTRAEVGALLTD